MDICTIWVKHGDANSSKSIGNDDRFNISGSRGVGVSVRDQQNLKKKKKKPSSS